MILILNGPPGCGKDTIAGILHDKHGYSIRSFKEPMWSVAKSILTPSEYDLFVRLYMNRETKDEPQEFLGNLSPRGFFIHISEVFVKPLLGTSQFGKLAAWGGLAYKTVFPDGGFPAEVNEFAGDKRTLLVRLHREGYSFEGDSRDYIEDAPVRSMDILLFDNEPMKAVDQIIRTVTSLERYDERL